MAASLQNYLSDEANRGRCLRPDGNVEFIAIDSQFAEYRYRLEAPDSLIADKIFDARVGDDLAKPSIDQSGHRVCG